ncbi:CRISPR-associated endonuclease Cas2 [Chondromyces crocatus]|uniref:CRISPR-associated endoribonuclease Cas2 n=1 Tax=Chondromyces crocatus TaxID=52 RepID=A0A0K1EKJ7_CHOCO|nr:CRISPR-associated endonuclease Cas2 [Chondromyces crocatus]AKT41103.1 CRISPR-associated endonuclease Cas2 [Chondromyces crocatus]
MAEPRHWHLVMYDVSEPSTLRKVHKTLSAWGKPMQYSAFRVRGTARELARLRFELSAMIDGKDRLMVIRLCSGCAARVSVQGEALAPLEADPPPFRMV